MYFHEFMTAEWLTLSFSEHSTQCSVTCGQGRTTRQVVCVNYSDHVIDQSKCDPDYIPETSQDCFMSPCPQRTPDSVLAQNPFQNVGYHPRSFSPSQTHVLGGNQWRTGPWGAVSIYWGLFLTCLLLFHWRHCLRKNRREIPLKHFFHMELTCIFTCLGVIHSG